MNGLCVPVCLVGGFRHATKLGAEYLEQDDDDVSQATHLVVGKETDFFHEALHQKKFEIVVSFVNQKSTCFLCLRVPC